VSVPVSFINRANIPDCNNRVTNVIINTHKESIIRSVTTVPKDLENETPSYLARIPHLDTSPILGITRFAAYETNIAYTLLAGFGYSPNGANDRFHLQPRNKCPKTPNTSEKSIHQ
jgi:hypothetical protein